MRPDPIIFDCDPGLDDAVAILLAVGSGKLPLAAITTVAGNAPADVTGANARAILQHIGSDIPVFSGCKAPIIMQARHAAHVHGLDGLGGAVLERPATTGVDKITSCEYLRRFLTGRPERSVTICLVGPQTNLATVLIERPELARSIRELVIMGGAICLGNVTPAAEFNVWFDPHASAVVFRSGVPIVLIPLDITESVLINAGHIETLVPNASRRAQLAHELLVLQRAAPKFGGRGCPVHDACAIGYLLWPELFTGASARVTVDISEGLCRGRTLVDWHGSPDERNAHVITGCAQEPLIERILGVLRGNAHAAL